MNSISQWIRSQRSSTRLGFVLQSGTRVGFAVLSLVWTPLLVESMGKRLNGLFLTFQGLTSMGGLGDFGMGGYVNIRTSRLLGQGKDDELRSFLAAARGAFLLFTLIAAGLFVGVSPSLLGWLQFGEDAGVGSMPLLILAGALAIGLFILNSYTNNLNYGCANITWPILPTFFAIQLATLTHWLLARQGAPLWVQFAPYVVSAAVVQVLGWMFVKTSHPALATLWPLNFDRRNFLSLAGQSFWVYLYSVPVVVHITVSRLLISGVFGPEVVPVYAYNNRLAELAMFVVTSASLASVPKITQWLASPEPETRARAITELTRLNKFQTLLGCMAVLAYLTVNDWFIRFWLGPDFHAPLSWQAAFAGFLGVTAAGLMGFDLASRCCDHGIRVGGILTLCSTFLNLTMCWVAVKFHSIFGIALAAAVTQLVVVLALGWFSSRQLKISFWHLSLKNALLALAMVGFGLLSQRCFLLKMELAIPAALAVNLLALLIAFRVTGVTLADLKHEQAIFRALLGRKKDVKSSQPNEEHH